MNQSDEIIRVKSQLGLRLGEIIRDLIQLIADIDGCSYDQVLETVFADWWATKIAEGR